MASVEWLVARVLKADVGKRKAGALEATETMPPLSDSSHRGLRFAPTPAALFSVL